MQFIGYVEPVTMQFGVLFLFNQDDQVAGRAASFAGIAPTAHAKLHSFLNAGGDVESHGLFTINAPFAFANSTLRRDDGTFAVARGTSGYGLHLTKESIA